MSEFRVIWLPRSINLRLFVIYPILQVLGEIAVFYFLWSFEMYKTSMLEFKLLKNIQLFVIA